MSLLTRKKILTKTEELTKYKNSVKKRYPNAFCKLYNDKYYIDDGFGNRISSEYFEVDNANSITNAWKNAKLILQIIPIIERNVIKFNQDKIYDSFDRKKDDKCTTNIENKDTFNF